MFRGGSYRHFWRALCPPAPARRVLSVDGRSIFRLFGKPADGRLAGVCEVGVVCDHDACRASQQAAYYRPFYEYFLYGELGAAEKPGGHSAGDGTEPEAEDEVA